MKRAKVFWLVFLATAAVFAFSLAPTLSSEESATWVINSLMYGLPSPPGNFFYLLTCAFWYKIATLPLNLLFIVGSGIIRYFSPATVFIFEPATSVNMVSMFSGAAAAGLTFVLLDRLAVSVGAGSRTLGDSGRRMLLASASVFLFCLPSIWSSSLQAGPEIFNIFLLLLSIWILVRIEEGSLGAGSGIVLWAFLMGLSFSEQYVFLFGVMFLVVYLSFDGRPWQALRANLAPVLTVFAVGLTLYIYLPVHPRLDPGLGQPVEIFSKLFWEYFYGLGALRHSMPRNAAFFTNQIPLLLGYFKLQSPHWVAGIVLLVVFHYSLIRTGRGSRRIFYWGLGLLLGFMFLQLWLVNPKLGPQQAPEITDPTKHEFMDLERSFLISYLLFGAWVVLGLLWLKDDLTLLLRKGVNRYLFTEKSLRWLPGAGLFTILCLLPVSTVYFNWKQASLSNDFVVADMGRNMLQGSAENAILIASGDPEYYSILYAKNFLFGDTTRSVVNFYDLADPAYLKNLDRIKPPVEKNYSNEQIDRMRNARLTDPFDFQAGKLQIHYPKGTVLMVRDLALLDIIRANQFKRPLYYSDNLGPENMVGMQNFLVRRGMLVQLLDHDPMAQPDSSFYWRGMDQLTMDINMTSRLLWVGYTYHSTLKEEPPQRQDRRSLLRNYARAYTLLADAFLKRDNVKQATLNFREVEFFDPEYSQRQFLYASWMAQAGQYDAAKLFATEYFKSHPGDPLKWAGLAKIALDKADSTAAVTLLVESIKVDPDFQLGFQKLVRLYDSMDQKLMASAVLSRWVARHTNDQEARRLWEQYSATKTLPPEFPD